jgi:hypothetical protein
MPLDDDSKYVTTYLENIRITIEGPKCRFEANTDSEGRYRITGLSPGRYKVRADLPEHLHVHSSGEVEVVDRGCAEVDFPVHVDGQISGLVTIVPSISPDLELEVEVFWPDGTPADTVAVTLHAGGPSFHNTGDRASKLRPGVYRSQVSKAAATG